MPIGFQVQRIYPVDVNIQHWRGTRIVDPNEFELFLQGPVKDRVSDSAFVDQLAHDLRALATTNMATKTLNSLLSVTPPPLDWEIGEAMSECLLTEEFGAVWPWNENRDRKTPRASLPGADLVGFLGEGEETVLLFGEVKTSSDTNTPPGVMNGRGGLAHQIDSLAVRTDLHFSLVNWLAARCKGTPLWGRFEFACKRYLQSGGTDVALVGVLLRDTQPHQDDLRTRAEALAARDASLPRVRLDAWYAPRPITEWVELVTAP